MFKVVQDRQFNQTVEVHVPVDGGFEKQSFTCRFRSIGVEETEAHDLTTSAGTVEFLKLAVVSFGGDLVDENEEPLTYNTKLRDAMLDDYPIRQALIQTYLASMSKGRAGN